MASMLSRKLCRLILSNPYRGFPSAAFCTAKDYSASDPDDSDALESAPSDTELDTAPSSPSPGTAFSGVDRSLQDGLDVGIYKAIIVGQVGQTPLQKKLNSGRSVTLVSVGTGGIRNNRRPFDNEDPREYANRCAVQWHRVSIYPERLGDLAMKNLAPGSIVYIEGNLETKIFNDAITGLVRRVREIAIRRNGRILFLGNGGDSGQRSQGDLKGVGYY